MANYVFQDVNSDLTKTNTLNWGAVAPGNNDVVIFAFGDENISSGLTTFDANTGMTLKMGQAFAGYLGTTTVPAQFHTGTTIEYRGSRCKYAYIDIAGGNAYIYDQAPGSSLKLTGTYTNILSGKSTNLVITQGATLTNLISVSPNNNIFIEAGATITNVYLCNGGKITSECDVTNVYIHGGEYRNVGNTEGDITLVECRSPNSLFYWNSPSSTIGNIIVYGGLADASAAEQPQTLTNGSVYYGGTLDLATDTDIITNTNPILNYGGKLKLGKSGTRTIYIEDQSF